MARITVFSGEGAPAVSDDWRSYDLIAASYDDVWGARFAEAARHLADQVEAGHVRRALDIGTGTAVNAGAITRRFGPLELVVGCDLSPAMLGRARARVPGLRPVLADAGRLPFLGETFDLAAAGFVLSHLRDCSPALREVFRVLGPSGVIAVSNWAASTDPFGPAWADLIGTVLPRDTVARTNEAVAPSEAELADPAWLRRALDDAGFVRLRVESYVLALTFTVDEFLADRALSSGGRFACRELGHERWAEFLSRARAEMERRFGPRFTYDRGVWIATASKPPAP